MKTRKSAGMLQSRGYNMYKTNRVMLTKQEIVWNCSYIHIIIFISILLLNVTFLTVHGDASILKIASVLPRIV